MKEKVVVLGASEKKTRYSYLAFKMLEEFGHEAILVSPRLKELEGKKVYAKLGDILERVDSLTVYVGPEISTALQEGILALKPRRVIFNPGSENPALAMRLREAGVAVEEACTLVLLRTNQFEN